MSSEKIKLDTINDKLIYIQQNLIVGKEQYNSFGKFSYRTMSDVLIAVKPLLDETACALVISDEIVDCGGRVYVKASANLIDAKSGETITVTGYAREAEKLSGMSDAQVTGGASTYSRKYALNGLLAIDDTLDPDAVDNKKATSKTMTKVDLKTGEVIVDTETAAAKLTKLVKKEEK